MLAGVLDTFTYVDADRISRFQYLHRIEYALHVRWPSGAHGNATNLANPWTESTSNQRHAGGAPGGMRERVMKGQGQKADGRRNARRPLAELQTTCILVQGATTWS